MKNKNLNKQSTLINSMKMRASLIFLAILLSLALVQATEYGCSNNTDISSRVKEIRVGESESIKGIGIGVTYADEAMIVGRMVADIMVDSEKVSLSIGSNTSVKLESGTFSIELINSTGETTTISVDGTSKEIEQDESESINSLIIFLISSTTSESGGEAEIIAGKEELNLDLENPSEIVVIEEEEYLVELSSASDNDASIRISTCDNGEIIELEATEEINESVSDTNQTLNETLQDETIHNTTEINETEENITDSSQLNNESLSKGTNQELGSTCNEDSECLSNKCESDKCVKAGIFSRFWSWLKGLFP